MIQIITLLQLALALLVSVQQNPNLDQAFKDTAISIANQAIQTATMALGQQGSSTFPPALGATPIATPTLITQEPPKRVIDFGIVNSSQSGSNVQVTFKFGDSQAGNFLTKQLVIKQQMSNASSTNIGGGRILYDSYNYINDGTPNSLTSRLLLHFDSRTTPKTEEDLRHHFLTAFYDGNFYRITLAPYINIGVIPECEQKVDEFLKDPTVNFLKKTRNSGNYSFDWGSSWSNAVSSYDDFFANHCEGSLRYSDLGSSAAIEEWVKEHR